MPCYVVFLNEGSVLELHKIFLLDRRCLRLLASSDIWGHIYPRIYRYIHLSHEDMFICGLTTWHMYTLILNCIQLSHSLHIYLPATYARHCCSRNLYVLVFCFIFLVISFHYILQNYWSTTNEKFKKKVEIDLSQ